MTKTKKIIIAGVAVLLAAAVAAVVIITALNKVEPFEGVGKFTETILFENSFEDDETGVIENTAEQGTNVSLKAGGSGMTTVRSSGPKYNFGGISETGWTGDRALEVNGIHNGSGEANQSNLIFKDINIAVTKDTHLSYVMYPSTLSEDHYDHEYTGMYMCVEALFTDGSRLTEMNAIDQNGFGYSPESQGDSMALYTNQWNFIRVNLGDVAEGKTIDKLLISYSKDDNENSGDSEFLTYFDDVTISEIANMRYDHLADYVDTRRGSNSTSNFSRGLCPPSANYPNGFNFFTPVTDKDNTLLYFYQLSGERNTMSSISIEHIASVWVGDFGTWQFMPSTALDASGSVEESDLNSENRAAEFSHRDETAGCYYYSVKFAEGSKASNVLVELTPTMYGAVVRFTFPEGSANSSIIFDCENGNGSLEYSEDMTSFFAYSDDTNQGSKRMHVYGEFSTNGESVKAYKKNGVITFPEGTTTVEMTLATSFISAEQAQKNHGFDFKKTKDFDEVCAVTRDVWNDVLGVVEIEGATYTQMVTYYSCLYRAMSYPNLITENTGSSLSPKWQYSSPYGGSNEKPLVLDGALVFNTGLWDTYRTAWPWYATYSKDTTLIDALLQHYTENGWNGAWICARGFQCMIGTHSDIIYADATVKGLRYNHSLAMESMLRNAATVKNKNGVGREEQETAVFTGYVTNNTPRGMSWTLDNCLNDFGLMVMANELNMEDEVAYYRNRAKAYVTMFNAELDFFIGKDANGNWSKNKYNYKPTDWLSDYTESNGWNMAFNMVYDAGGLASLYGGDAGFIAKLDEFFSTPVTNVTKDSIHEVREGREVRLGQYCHANQVAHHIAYMYDFTSQPYKTQEIVRSILTRCYVGAEIGQGYVGDEDNGEQSAWYVYSALGFYPTALATGEFTIGSPLFDKVTLHLETGDVTITANNNSMENMYIASCTVDGKPYNKTYITQEMLDNGADIVFEMTDKPTSWGTAEDSRPFSLTPYGESVNYMTDSSHNATVTSSGSDPQNAVDNTSDSYVKLSKTGGDVTLTYTSPVKAQIVTLTSGKSQKCTVTKYTLQASADGSNFVTIDERSNIEFKWGQYTRPFAIPEDKQGEYKAYKIIIECEEESNGLKLAEVELIG